MKKRKHSTSITRKSLVPPSYLAQSAMETVDEYEEPKILEKISEDPAISNLWANLAPEIKRGILDIARAIASDCLYSALNTVDDLIKMEKEVNPFDRYTIITEQISIDKEAVKYFGKIMCTRFCCGAQILVDKAMFDDEEKMWTWVDTTQNEKQIEAIRKFLMGQDKWYLFIFDHALDGTIISSEFYENVYRISVGLFDEEDEKLSKRAFLNRCRNMRKWKILKKRLKEPESYFLADGIATKLADF